MSYIAQQPRERFQFRMNETERNQIVFIMQHENIPDISKTIRYCIEQEVTRLKADHTARVNREGGTNE